LPSANLLRTGLSYFLLSLLVACGSSDGTAADGGRATDGGDGAGTDGGGGTGGQIDEHSLDGPAAGDGTGVDSRSDSTIAAGTPVDLGTAGAFVILAKSAISTVPTAAVTGDMGISPAAATFITGFGLTADASNLFAISPQVSGKVYAANYSSPTPAKMTAAIGDMERAFNDAAGRAPGVTELGAGIIGDMTLPPGVYKWGSGLSIPTDVTLNGGATGVWIFQIAQGLTVSSATKVILTGGALAKNVFWQVAGAVNLGTTAHLEGVVLCRTSITLLTGASVKGRLLAQTAVAIDASTVVQPAP
jgi:hypothetical protein